MSEERSELDKQVDAEMIAKGPDVIKDFDETQAITVTPKKKRGRPAKVAAPAPEVLIEIAGEIVEKLWHCPNCKEDFEDKMVMKIGAGDKRWAVFCPQCQRSFGFQDQEVLDRVAELIKNNPTGK